VAQPFGVPLILLAPAVGFPGIRWVICTTLGRAGATTPQREEHDAQRIVVDAIVSGNELH
jgi:hypothetical protein